MGQWPCPANTSRSSSPSADLLVSVGLDPRKNAASCLAFGCFRRGTTREKVRIMPAEHVETLIVGGGQAGLALSHMLSRRGCEHLVLERGRIAERWRTERWD